jgi:hypothetical protein
MKWLQEQVADRRGVDVDDLRISVTSSGGFAVDHTVALVVKKGTQSWKVFAAGAKATKVEAWKAFIDVVRREGTSAVRERPR